LKGPYFEQLNDPDSQASQHFVQMVSAVHELEKSDPEFLKTNYDIDADYFELEALPINAVVSF